MKYGMSDKQFDILNDLVLKPLKANGAQVFIFGSRLSDAHHPHSDVDLIFRLKPGKSFPAGVLSKIKEDIEESRFPFAVDLVNDENLAESYRDSVRKEMQPL